jgi:hypothetical protein
MPPGILPAPKGETMLAEMLLLAQLGAGEVVQHVTLQGVQLDVAASSVLVEKNQPPLRYGPANLVDEDAGTVWAEGVRGPGLGEWVELRFPRPTVLLGFEVLPGHGGSSRLFAANNSLVDYMVSVDGHTFTGGPLRGAESANEDLPVPAQVHWFAGPTPVSTLRLRVTETRKGISYDDTCISTFRPILADDAGQPLGDGGDLVAQAWRLAHAPPGDAQAFLSPNGVSFLWTTNRREGDKKISTREKLDGKPGPLEPAAADKLRQAMTIVRESLKPCAEEGQIDMRLTEFEVSRTAAKAGDPAKGATDVHRHDRFSTYLSIDWTREPQGWKVARVYYDGP